MLAIYLSKTYHGGAPVAFLDTEKGSDFVKPYFDQEGVEFLVDKTRAFIDLRDAHAQALKLGACVLVADSLTHYWQELLRSVKGERKRLDIKLIGEAKERWSEFTENYDRALVHYLVAGRLGYDWENVDIEDEEGNIKNELLKGQSKKAEGDFSYEPDLVLELSSADDPNAADYKKLKKGSRIKKLASSQIHIANVKKCRVRALNGQMFSWPDRGAYKPGDYKKVDECFLPYFDFLNIGGEHVAFDASRSSQRLVDEAGRRDFFQQQRRREIACQEIKGSLGCVWSAATGKDAALKTEVINALFGTHSWTAVEKLPPDILENGAKVCVRMKNLAIRRCRRTVLASLTSSSKRRTRFATSSRTRLATSASRRKKPCPSSCRSSNPFPPGGIGASRRFPMAAWSP